MNVGVGNVWGPLVRRIAKSGVQRFWGHVEARLRADDPNPFAGLRPVREAFARLLPLSEPVLLGAFRRWIEHEIAQAIAIEAEVASGGASLPGAVTVAFLFCDLTGFTAFADAEGDAAADSFARIVAEQRGEFLLMKSLGDGAMLVYPEGIAAVSAAARIIEQTRLRSPLPVHAGAHVGAAIARDGDYDGSSVNLAARLLGVAQPDQLIATREVVDRTADSYNWEPLGSQEIRGIGQPVGRLLPAFPGGRIHGPAPLSVVRDVGAQRTWSSRAVSSGSPGSPRMKGRALPAAPSIAASDASATTDAGRTSQRPRQLFEQTRADQRPDPPEDEVDTYQQADRPGRGAGQAGGDQESQDHGQDPAERIDPAAGDAAPLHRIHESQDSPCEEPDGEHERQRHGPVQREHEQVGPGHERDQRFDASNRGAVGDRVDRDCDSRRDQDPADEDRRGHRRDHRHGDRHDADDQRERTRHDQPPPGTIDLIPRQPGMERPGLSAESLGGICSCELLFEDWCHVLLPKRLTDLRSAIGHPFSITSRGRPHLLRAPEAPRSRSRRSISAV